MGLSAGGLIRRGGLILGVRRASESEKIVGYVPDTLAEILYPLMTTWKIISVTATVEGNHRAAPEGMWVPGGGIEIPSTYKLYGVKLHLRRT